MTPDDYRRILLVRLTSFGDVVRATGFPAALKKACPRAEIVVVTAHSFAPLFAAVPGIDRLIGDSGAPRLLGVWREARQELRQLRRDGGFDLAIDLQGTRPSAAEALNRLKNRRQSPEAERAGQGSKARGSGISCFQ